MIKEIIVFSMYFEIPFTDFSQWNYLQIYDVHTTPYFSKGVLNATNIFIICLTMLEMFNIIQRTYKIISL